MTVGEVRKYLADFKDEQEFLIEMVPNYKLTVVPLPVVESVETVKDAEIVEDVSKEESKASDVLPLVNKDV